MRVFAKYFTDDVNGIEYRKNTLLQFGNTDDPKSWELIGSLFLINPGSAKPISDQHLEGELLNKILEFLPNEQKSNDWYEFKSDPTMRFVESLFCDKYIQKTKVLTGVIQLFNLFNLRDQNLEKAIMKMEENIKNSLIISFKEDLKLIKNKPVYLGWGTKGKTDINLNIIAKEIFERVKFENINNYLNEKFENNSFYHPIYINRSLRRPKVKALLENFSKDIYTDKSKDIILNSI
jgi:hypothetical protein